MSSASDSVEAVVALLTEAARSRVVVRVFVTDTTQPTRGPRIVEGTVLAVADGRDGRTRVRLGINTGMGDPVEVRILVEGIQRAETVEHGHGAEGRGRGRRSEQIFRGSQPSLEAATTGANEDKDSSTDGPTRLRSSARGA